MLKEVRIEMTGAGMGAVYVDDVRVHGVRTVRVETEVHKPNRVTLGLLSRRVTFTGIAEVTTTESRAYEFEALERGTPADEPCEDVRLISDAARLQLEPDDVLVLNCPGLVSDEAKANIAAALRAAIGGNHRVVVLEPGLSLGAVGPARSPTAPPAGQPFDGGPEPIGA